MLLPEQVREWIATGLDCVHLTVEGDGQHFQAVIVSPSFTGRNMIQQHRLVYDALGERMHAQIHALSMKTYTPEDWASR